jgi:ketosteroid isomerase-like protein
VELDGQAQARRGAAVAFNDAINRRDLRALAALMTDGHTFVDSADVRLAGKDAVVEAWRGFFEAFPDYRNDWTHVITVGDAVVAVGCSACPTEPELDGPAIWTATTDGDRISEWRVLDDTPANRRRVGLAAAP